MDRLVALARLSVEDPRQAARALLAANVPMSARSGGLLLVAVVSALMASIYYRLLPEPADPATAFMMASPFRTAIVQWLFLALTVFLIHRVGRAFGGRGSFEDALLVVVWLQLVMLAVQVVQLVALALVPPLAGIIGLASIVLFFWLMSGFIAELHGFASRQKVLAGMLLVIFGAGLVIAAALVAFFGPEAFVPDV